MRRHRAVPGHDESRASGKGAFRNSIVGLAGKDRQRFGWLDELTQLGKKDGNARECFAIMDKLPGRKGEELVENGSGKGERVLTLDNLAERLVASPAGHCESRYRHVRLEKTTHSIRHLGLPGPHIWC